MSKSVQVLVGCAAVLVCLYVLDKDPALAKKIDDLVMLVIWVGLPLFLLILGGAWVWDTVTKPSRMRRGVREIIEEEARRGRVWDEARGGWVYDEERARTILDDPAYRQRQKKPEHKVSGKERPDRYVP